MSGSSDLAARGGEAGRDTGRTVDPGGLYRDLNWSQLSDLNRRPTVYKTVGYRLVVWICNNL
jgi:hypothetical protein